MRPCREGVGNGESSKGWGMAEGRRVRRPMSNSKRARPASQRGG